MTFNTYALLLVLALVVLVESIFDLRKALALREDLHGLTVSPVQRRWAWVLVFWNRFSILMSGVGALYCLRGLTLLW
jgi:hypothetical protein